MCANRRGRIHALDASGPAGSLATIRRYRDKDYDAIPPRGPDAALTVAGAVSGWGLALELAQALGGQMPLDLLLGDAIRFAREGYAVAAAEGRNPLLEEAALFAAPGFAEAFLVEGKLPEAGTQRKSLKLADTLDRLAHAGLADFYRGDVGREIAADLERIESPVTRKDLETYRARVVQPLSVRLKHSTVYNLPPPSQGLATLLILGMFERLNVKHGETPEHHHGLIEAVKRAFAIRDRVVTDPGELTHDPADFLTPDFAGTGGGHDREPPRRALSAAPGRGRYGLDGLHRQGRAGGVLHPVRLLGLRLRLRAAGNGRPLAQPGPRFLARPQESQSPGAGPQALSHPQSGALPSSMTGACSPTEPWAATGSRRPWARFLPAMPISA